MDEQSHEAGSSPQPHSTASAHSWGPGGRHRGAGRYFFGLLIIFVGLIYLARNFGWIDDIGLGAIFSQLWPVLLIFAGLSLLSRGGTVSRVLSIVLAVVVLSLLFMLLIRPAGGRTVKFRTTGMSGGAWNFSMPPSGLRDR